MNQIALVDLHDRTAEILSEVRNRKEEFVVMDGGAPVARLSPLAQQSSEQELAAAVAALHGLDDNALWKAAKDRLPEEATERFQDLNRKQQRDGLSNDELRELDDLRSGYDRVVLLRAEAAFLLKERGHDISVLLSNE